MRKLVNFVAFQAGWFACVLGAAHGHPWLGCLSVVVVFGLHLALAPAPRGELRLAAVTVAVGLVLEIVLVSTGIARYAEPGPIAFLPPVWILAMWLLLATLLDASLAWLQNRPWLGALFAAVGAPLSYAAGARLGGMEIGAPLWRSYVVMGVLWAAVFPLLVLAARRSSTVASTSVVTGNES